MTEPDDEVPETVEVAPGDVRPSLRPGTVFPDRDDDYTPEAIDRATFDDTD